MHLFFHRVSNFLYLAIIGSLITACTNIEIDSSNDFPNNGRDESALVRDNLYLKERLIPGIPRPDATFRDGLTSQIRYLNKIKTTNYTLDNLTVAKTDLLNTAQEINTWLDNAHYLPQLSAHQITGQDQRGNVQITGYYVPVMKVSHTKTDVYKYPLYRKPKPSADGSFPTREEIDFEGALDGKGLEIAYTASLVDNFFLHVQGSGVIEYEDGQQALLSWGGVNGHAYRSLGKELIERGEIDREHISAQSIRQWLADHPNRVRELLSTNPSYLFFAEGNTRPIGAANVPLTPLYSVAVDPNVIPLGAILLGELPILDDSGQLIRHEFRLLLAQDKGGAIKGPGHIDWYQGIGEEAHFHAGQLKHFGRVWLLLPR
ncbi:murein transglycosylase A [Marinomonas balearica]|uniref:peptidoglycan lytic exotransglycosylase n=1 Tax=Marinomonas balearica TaxID=491947 RepID=A0A4R6M3K6_9GAMM|nr:murein transglycosylase A [Marinomonas balearica]TDO95833.1 membrane-bound lytic murein transglycosylase A [Marinomonas balearica]